MPPYEHRKSRFLHQYRYGWEHYNRHRNGIHHKHRRRRNKILATPPASPTAKERSPLRSWAIAISGVAIVIVVLLMVGAYQSITEARSHLRYAEATASNLAHNPNQLTSADGRLAAKASLDLLNSEARQAAKTVNDSWSLSILGTLPIIGTQVDGVRSLVNDLDTASAQARLMLGDLNAMTSNSTATDISIPDLETLSSQVDQSNVVLSGLITSPNGLYGPIKNARMTFDSDMTKITGLLSRGGQALHYAIPFLGGSGQKTYFLAAENNAEMRDQGAVLSWALLQATNGSYSVDSAQPVSALYLRAPAPFTLPQGTQTVFGALNPTQLWQSTNPWADFTLSGADMSTMYTAATHGQHVDGVIALDVVTLRDILGLTGPVKVPDLPIPVNAGNVESLVLNRLYARYPPDAQQARRDELSAIAKAAVDALKKSKVDVAQLVKTFSKDVEGRHLILWDANATNERTVDSFGASGSVSSVDPTHTFHLAVESAVAAKLDYYIHTSIAYNVTLDKSGQALVQTRVTLENRAPRSGAPSYVLGPDNINSHRPGEYVSSIYLWSPAGSSTPGGISESGLVVAPTNTTVEAGSSASVSFQTVIPHAVVNGHLVLRFVPQSSMSPQTITLRVSGHDVAVQAPPQSSWLATSTKIISLPVG